jgi:hypothetical protein
MSAGIDKYSIDTCNRMVHVPVKHTRVSFSKRVKIARVLLSKFNEKPLYYVY